MGLIFEGCQAGKKSLDDFMDMRSMCCDPDEIGFQDNMPMFKMQIHSMPVYKDSGFGGRFKANKGAGSVCDMVKSLVKGAMSGFGNGIGAEKPNPEKDSKAKAKKAAEKKKKHEEKKAAAKKEAAAKAAAKKFDMKAGLTVALKGGRSGRWCADEANKVICNRGHVAQWERFKLGDAGSGKVALKGGRTGRWCADEGNRIKCSRGHIRQWEKFTVKNLGGGKTAMKGGNTKKWCSDDARKNVICNRGHIQQWEKFSVKKQRI